MTLYNWKISAIYLFLFIFRERINEAGFSADGDSRLLSCMLHCTKFNAVDSHETMSAIEPTQTPVCCTQDTIHIGTKLRNRLLVPSIHLPLGSRLISVAHLKILINDVSKDIHGLVMKDICPDDRQNYGSLEKIMEPRERNSLGNYVAGSEGITSSLRDVDISPLERIYRMWFATYFVRAWRKWISHGNTSSSSHHTLKYNFISNNAYSCIEVNAANLVSLTQSFRDQNMEKLFLPSLFNSQPNEEIFRQFRSMGTMNYTKINFSLLELFHLVGRVELQNDIVYVKLAEKGIFFPRNKINSAKTNEFPLPSNSEISNEIMKAKKDALNEISEFGISIEAAEIASYEHVHNSELQNIHLVDILTRELVDSDTDQELSNAVESTDFVETLKSSTSIDITLPNGTQKRIRKSTYLWTLTDSQKHLSNDRLKRVQEAKRAQNPVSESRSKRRLVFKKQMSQGQTESILTLAKNDEVQIGDWCIFQMKKNPKQGENIFVLGCVLCFKYIDGRTAKQKQYSWDFAPINPPVGTKKRGIEVLSSWYEVGSSTNFSPVNELNSFYINIEKYIFTMNCSNIKVDGKYLSFTNDMKTLEQFKEQLKKQTSQ